MAKFNEYTIRAERDDGVTIVEKQVTALGLEQAWHKAVTEAFEAIEEGTGDTPEAIYVYRIKAASESHG
jgi:hypothetical protein